MRKHRNICCLLIIVTFIFFFCEPKIAVAENIGFVQGSGYQTGTYDDLAVQATTFNWKRQSRFSGPFSPIKEWEFRVDNHSGTTSRVLSPPIIGRDGTIYVTDAPMINVSTCMLYAINNDGTLKWTYNIGSSGNSPIIGKDGLIYITGSFDDHNVNLFCIYPDGSLKWKANLKDNSPAYSKLALGQDGTIYIGGENGLYAFNGDGTIKWSFVPGDPFIRFTDPVIGSNGLIYVGTIGHVVGPNSAESGNGVAVRTYAVDSNGKLKWSIDTIGSRPESTAIDEDGTLYIGGDDLYGVNPDGTIKFRTSVKSSGGMRVPSVAEDGTIYVNVSCQAGFDNFYAFDKNGNIKWSYKTDGFPLSSTIIDKNGNIYLNSSIPYLYTDTNGKERIGENSLISSIDENGKCIWKYSLSGKSYITAPTLGSDGCLYVGLSDNVGGLVIKIGNDFSKFSKGDVNYDGVIDIRDLAVLAKDYNSRVNEVNKLEDLNNDNIIDIYDLVKVSKNIY